MKSHFWKFFLLWYIFLLFAFGLYHAQATKVRIQDFKIKKVIFTEYQQNHQLPAYLSLSKADFHSTRYQKNRDELLRSGEITGYTLNQIDELVKEKEVYQFWLSVLMWGGLFCLLLGCIIWLRLFLLLAFSFVQRDHLKDDFIRFVLVSILILMAFSFSKVVSEKFRQTISSDYDFDHAMQVALKVDDYYQRVLGDLIDVSQLFYEASLEQDTAQMMEKYRTIKDKALTLKMDLQKFQGLKSSFINFDGVDLVNQAESVCESVVRVVEKDEKNDLLRDSLEIYQDFIVQLMNRRHMQISAQALDSFSAKQIAVLQGLNPNGWQENPSVLYYGYFIYQALASSIR